MKELKNNRTNVVLHKFVWNVRLLQLHSEVLLKVSWLNARGPDQVKVKVQSFSVVLLFAKDYYFTAALVVTLRPDLGFRFFHCIVRY